FSGNNLLDGLSAAAVARLQPHCEMVTLPLGETIAKSKAAIDYVYFPQSGVLSFVGLTGNEQPIEVGMVGSEGLAGLSLFLGVPRSPNDVIVQASGAAIRIKAESALAEFARRDRFHDAILSFANALFQQISATTSCNRHHEVEQRLSRW